MNRLNRLREGLARTRAQLIARLGEIAGAPPAEFFEQLEITLIEADVQVGVAKDFIARVEARAVGDDVLKSLTPGQQVVGIVHEELESLLLDSVRLRMIADVPVGIMLSGGVDSSLVTAMAARVTSRPRTFNISFPGYGTFDEAPYARMVAKQWIRVEEATGAIGITPGGRRSYVVVLALDGRIASKALSGFSAPEIVEFCGYLKRVIANTDAGTPDVWTYTASSTGESMLATTGPTGATSP